MKQIFVPYTYYTYSFFYIYFSDNSIYSYSKTDQLSCEMYYVRIPDMDRIVKFKRIADKNSFGACDLLFMLVKLPLAAELACVVSDDILYLRLYHFVFIASSALFLR